VDGQPAAPGLWEAITTNVLAFGLFFIVFAILSRASNSMGLPWQVEHFAELLVHVLGVGIALRLGARTTAIGLAGIGIAQLAGFVMHILFGIDAVQGGPVKLALMFTGILGVILGRIAVGPTLLPRLRGPLDEPVPDGDPHPHASAAESDPRRLFNLRTRPG